MVCYANENTQGLVNAAIFNDEGNPDWGNERIEQFIKLMVILSRVASFTQQLCNGMQLLHMLRHDLHDDDDRNAQQHAPHPP